MAESWLKRLELLDVTKNNKDRRRPYSFDYGKYDEEQSYGSYFVRPDLESFEL